MKTSTIEKARERNRAYLAANRERESERKRAWHAANRERANARRSAYRAANAEGERERSRAYRKANPEGVRDYLRAYKTANPDKVNTYSATRRAGKLQRTPAWADQAAIDAVYAEAQAYRELGCDVHVDHFYPLKGKLVSGLHVHNNLQVLLAEDNLAKHAKFEV